MYNQKILIIGEVFVDTHLDILPNDTMVRLGGIFHSARAFDSIKCNFTLAYYAPNYLDKDIAKFSSLLNGESIKLGSIDKCPNIMLINESKETGDQGYISILKDQAEFVEDVKFFDVMTQTKPTDILLYPGRYNKHNILNGLSNYDVKLHIDLHYDSDNLLENCNGKIETAILSTSSTLFKNECNGCFDGVCNYLSKFEIKSFLVKENRGGSYYYSFEQKEKIECPSDCMPIMHSVGLGDVYNSIFVNKKESCGVYNAMRVASFCAANYAQTMKHEDFVSKMNWIVDNESTIIELKGVRLGWEKRKDKNIYMAAPDFPAINKNLLNKLGKNLEYHNFTPRFPIRENGLINIDDDYPQKVQAYNADFLLLEQCDLMIATVLYDDPGTFVELGIFSQMGKPVIIFDPYDLCKNMFAQLTADHLCATIEETILATYQCLQEKSA